MSKSTQLILGLVAGLVGYMIYKKMNTPTTVIDTTANQVNDVPMLSTSPVGPSGGQYAMMAGTMN